MARGKPPALDVLAAQTFRQLQTLPGVGAATAGDLIRLGVASLDDLAFRDPHLLYDGLTALDGTARDPALLATLAAAINAARTGDNKAAW